MIDLSKTIDLSTTYLGLKLRNPLVASLRHVRRSRQHPPMEDAGAAAVVLHSLFEEQIDARKRRARPLYLRGLGTSSGSDTAYFPEMHTTIAVPRVI